MAGGLVGRKLRSERVYKAGPFQLQRFITDLDTNQENHIGEAIVRDDGTIEYLKTYRLSQAQVRRAYLLQKLAEHHWSFSDTAKFFKETRVKFVYRLIAAGFGYVVSPKVMDEVRREEAAAHKADEERRKREAPRKMSHRAARNVLTISFGHDRRGANESSNSKVRKSKGRALPAQRLRLSDAVDRPCASQVNHHAAAEQLIRWTRMGDMGQTSSSES